MRPINSILPINITNDKKSILSPIKLATPLHYWNLMNRGVWSQAMFGICIECIGRCPRNMILWNKQLIKARIRSHQRREVLIDPKLLILNYNIRNLLILKKVRNLINQNPNRMIWHLINLPLRQIPNRLRNVIVRVLLSFAASILNRKLSSAKS